jgi:hypothetical protein
MEMCLARNPISSPPCKSGNNEGGKASFPVVFVSTSPHALGGHVIKSRKWENTFFRSVGVEMYLARNPISSPPLKPSV